MKERERGGKGKKELEGELKTKKQKWENKERRDRK